MKGNPLLAAYHMDDANIKLPKHYMPPMWTQDWGKLSLQMYLSMKAWRAGVPYGSIRAARLMGSPIEQQRIPLREAVRVDGDSLARRAHKFLTLAKEYNERERYAKMMAAPIKQYIPALTGTSRLPCAPFESGRNTLPGMEKYRYMAGS